jgi:hypothetical protein
MAFTDLIKGDLTKAAKDLPDFVIVRSDGNPVFHLANVVDDIHMASPTSSAATTMSKTPSATSPCSRPWAPTVPNTPTCP